MLSQLQFSTPTANSIYAESRPVRQASTFVIQEFTSRHQLFIENSEVIKSSSKKLLRTELSVSESVSLQDNLNTMELHFLDSTLCIFIGSSFLYAYIGSSGLIVTLPYPTWASRILLNLPSCWLNLTYHC